MHVAELIADALVRTEACSADVRKAALLRISRVQTIVSPAQAQQTLESGLAASHGLPDPQHRGFEQLSRLAVAAVAPERLAHLPPAPSREMFLSDQLARVMREHGHEEYLRTYVLHDAPLAEVPLSGVAHLLATAKDDEDERRLLLRRAVEVWRGQELNSHPGARPLNQFHLLFRQWWKILPREEALTILREIISRLLEKPDSVVHGQIEDTRFTSIRALEVFHSFDVLLELDQERARQLVGAYPELAVALERYPKGLRSMEEEAEAKRTQMPPPDPNKRGGFGMVGQREDFDYGWALLEAEKTRDFSKPLEYAAARYRQDSDSENPNKASKAFWPSGAMYQAIFYRIGKTSEDPAALNMDVVPDAELRLFAQIELAAGLCKLPELSSMTQRMPGQRAGRVRGL